MDVLVLLDESETVASSATTGFETIRKYGKALTEAVLDEGENARAGVSSFSTTARLISNFYGSSGVKGLLSKIDDIDPVAKSTDTSRGIKHAISTFHDSTSGARNWKDENGKDASVEEILVVISDGDHKDQEKDRLLAYKMLKNAGIKLVTIFWSPSVNASADVLITAKVSTDPKDLAKSIVTSFCYHSSSPVKGRKGLEGNKGANGKDGEDGEPGVEGFHANDGEKGAKGVQGPSGLTGNQGPQGSQGLKGNKGIEGEMGPRASKGRADFQGIKGSAGPSGFAGPQGWFESFYKNLPAVKPLYTLTLLIH